MTVVWDVALISPVEIESQMIPFSILSPDLFEIHLFYGT